MCERRYSVNIALIGRTEIMYDLIDILLDKGYHIVLISTSKAAPEYLRTERDFELKANEIGARFLYAPKISTAENIAFIKQCGHIDIAISVNHTSIVQQEVIDLFPLGILNIHGGDLPRYRGNACQAWAIINGENRIGLCVHKMESGSLDSGDIIVREYMNININTKVTECWNWIVERTPFMFLEALRLLEHDKDFVLQKQSKNIQDVLRCYPRNPSDGRICWSENRETILRLINASNKPYAGAFCFFKNTKLIIWDAELYNDDENYLAIPGQVSFWDMQEGFIVVITGCGKLKINEIEFNNQICKPAEILHSIRNRLE